MRCVLSKIISNNKISVYEKDGHFELYENEHFYCSCDTEEDAKEEIEFYAVKMKYLEELEKEN